jgi:rhodanese-related sulfurtransferase
MKMFSFLSRGLFVAASACLALGCTEHSASTTSPAAATVSSPAPAAPQKPADATPRISVAEARQLVDAGQAVIVDVRGTEAYKNQHIKGSIDHGIARMDAGDFAGLPKDKRIIAYCSCSAEQTSGRAGTLLEKAGFKNAAALVGGTSAWASAGYDMVQAPPAAPAPSPKAK